MSERDALTAVQELVAKSEQDERKIAWLEDRLRKVTDTANRAHEAASRRLTEAVAAHAEVKRLRTTLGDIGMFVAARLPEAKGGDAAGPADGRLPDGRAVTPPRSEAGPGRHPFKGGLGGCCSACPGPYWYSADASIHQPPAGFEWAGEFRVPQVGESYLCEGVGQRRGDVWAGRCYHFEESLVGPRHILRPVAQPQPEWQGHDYAGGWYPPSKCIQFVTRVYGGQEQDVRCMLSPEEHGPRPEVKP